MLFSLQLFLYFSWDVLCEQALLITCMHLFINSVGYNDSFKLCISEIMKDYSIEQNYIKYYHKIVFLLNNFSSWLHSSIFYLNFSESMVFLNILEKILDS